MRVSVVQEGRVLRQINYRKEHYIEVPPEGAYVIRVYNDSHRRRMCVLSVDGVNVVNGENAGYEGPGYVMNPWQTADIPGFRRDAGEVAAFTFSAKEQSYAAQTGRGISNVGVIGVAVFDEKLVVKVPVPRVEIHHWPKSPAPVTLGPSFTYTTTSTQDGWVTMDGGELIPDMGVIDSNPTASTFSCSTETSVTGAPQFCGVSFQAQTQAVNAVGTAYGAKKSFITSTTDFTRSSKKPAQILTFRYGTTDQLRSWGVPVNEQNLQPNTFPASQPAVAAPPGWNG